MRGVQPAPFLQGSSHRRLVGQSHFEFNSLKMLNSDIHYLIPGCSPEIIS